MMMHQTDRKFYRIAVTLVWGWGIVAAAAVGVLIGTLINVVLL